MWKNVVFHCFKRDVYNYEKSCQAAEAQIVFFTNIFMVKSLLL